MNWLSIGLAAACGAIAGLIAGLYTIGKKDKRTQFGAAFAIAFIVLYAISRVVLFPNLNAWYQARNVEAELLAMPTYQALKKYDREIYDKLIVDLKQGLKDGASEAEVITTMRGHMMKVVETRLPRASDESVVNYMGVTMKELEVLTKKGGDLCYRFLFPQSGGLVDPRQHFPKKLQEEDLAALTEVIRTSAEDPLPIPEESRFIPALQVIFTELSEEYGEDVQMLQNPTARGVNKRKICAMSAAMYDKIFALPRSESGPLLRFLLAPTDG